MGRSLLGHFVLSYSGVISTFRWLEPLGAKKRGVREAAKTVRHARAARERERERELIEARVLSIQFVGYWMLFYSSTYLIGAAT